MKLKKGDFITLSYTGKLKESNQVFDTTDEKAAKDAGVYNEKSKYKPVTVCIGEGDVLKGLDEDLVGKEVSHSYIVEVPPEKGFGKKDTRLMKIVNTNIFIKNQINPFPGLQVNIDNMIGVIKSVSPGRTVVDFNHPLAGKILVYEFTIVGKVNEPIDKVKGMLSYHLAVETPEVVVEHSTVRISNEIPDLFKEQFEDKVKKLIPEIKKVEFKKKEEVKKPEKA